MAGDKVSGWAAYLCVCVSVWTCMGGKTGIGKRTGFSHLLSAVLLYLGSYVHPLTPLPPLHHHLLTDFTALWSCSLVTAGSPQLMTPVGTGISFAKQDSC